MVQGRLAGASAFIVLLIAPPLLVFAFEAGEVTGRIERTNEGFVRDYEETDYEGKESWEAWGRGRKALGWIVIRGDSGKSGIPVLLMLDTRTSMGGGKLTEGRFPPLRPGDRVWARYRMGWDALHALEVRKLSP